MTFNRDSETIDTRLLKWFFCQRNLKSVEIVYKMQEYEEKDFDKLIFENEYNRMKSQHSNLGLKLGIEFGTSLNVQLGFDQGYKQGLAAGIEQGKQQFMDNINSVRQN